MTTKSYRYFIKLDEEGEFKLNSQPPVSFNVKSTQGDHSTAFAMMVRTIKRKIHYKNMDDYIKKLKINEHPIYKHFFDLISSVEDVAIKYNHLNKFKDDPLVQKLIDEQTELFTGPLGPKCKDLNDLNGKIQLIRDKYDEIDALLSALLPAINVEIITEKDEQDKITAYLIMEDDLTNFLANEYLKMRNKQIFVSFPAKGNQENVAAEGSNIRKALGQLDNLASGPRPSSLERDEFVKQVTGNLVATFWHPHIEDADMLEESTVSARGKPTLYRNNAISILSFICATHLKEFNSAYPEFHSDSMKDPSGPYTLAVEIKNSFLNSIIDIWKLKPNEADLFKKEIETALEYADATAFQSTNDSDSSSDSLRAATAKKIDRSHLHPSIRSDDTVLRKPTKLLMSVRNSESNPYLQNYSQPTGPPDTIMGTNFEDSHSSDSDVVPPNTSKPLKGKNKKQYNALVKSIYYLGDNLCYIFTISIKN